jgi:uncharacterized protein YndB with AHSA1/START domain
MTVTRVEAGPRQVSRSATVSVPAAELFALLADPAQHGRLDGSGTVLDAVKGSGRLSEGARFSVKMKQYGFPYRITSKVTAFVDGSLIEWAHPLGHRWRWELTPAGDGATTVTETFDYSKAGAVRARFLELMGFPAKNASGIEATLEQLQRSHA